MANNQSEVYTEDQEPDDESDVNQNSECNIHVISTATSRRSAPALIHSIVPDVELVELPLEDQTAREKFQNKVQQLFNVKNETIQEFFSVKSETVRDFVNMSYRSQETEFGFQCPVCLGLVYNPVQCIECKNNKYYCSTCVDELPDKKCPVCKEGEFGDINQIVQSVMKNSVMQSHEDQDFEFD